MDANERANQARVMGDLYEYNRRVNEIMDRLGCTRDEADDILEAEVAQAQK